MSDAKPISSSVRDIESVLAAYIDPHLGCSLLDAGAIDAIAVNTGCAELKIRLPYPCERHSAELVQLLREYLLQLPDIEDVRVDVHWQVTSQNVQQNLSPLPGIKNIIAVASGKGGVGKSTVAANLALALVSEGAAVGMLDADIYGPSQPKMLSAANRKPKPLPDKKIEPIESLGVKIMSMGFLVDEAEPMIWRGPMVSQALHQLLHDTVWGELDYLIVDLPPGTGDAHLSLVQKIPLAGAVVVTTPQDIALLDARKGLRMFDKVSVNVLGVIENMSSHICTQCGHEDDIFGQGGGADLAEQEQVDFLGQLPLDRKVREQADMGVPIVAAQPDGEISQRYREIALKAIARLSLATEVAFPEIAILDD